jgi:copper chaperone CopZ
MNKTLLLTFTVAVLLTNCKQTASSPSEQKISSTRATINPEKLEKATFSIDGMTCAIGCAKTIEKELANAQGVQNVVVDFDKKEATVSFDNSLQTPESITKIVEATADGTTYKVSNMVASK